jgi:hypothetical protein
MPSAKFIFPSNFGMLVRDEMFTIQIAINNLQTGVSTNTENTYMSSPQELNADGEIMGHSHVVIQQLTGFDQTVPTDPRIFVFFQTLTDPAVNGVLFANVTDGLHPGYYRIETFHSGANHQPSA